MTYSSVWTLANDVRLERNQLLLRGRGGLFQSNLLFRDGYIIAGHEIAELRLGLGNVEVQRLRNERLP